MSSVRYCSHTNSTLFTTCCGVAIKGEKVCPHCGEEVLPRSDRERHDRAMIAFYGREFVAQLRREAAKKYP